MSTIKVILTVILMKSVELYCGHGKETHGSGSSILATTKSPLNLWPKVGHPRCNKFKDGQIKLRNTGSRPKTLHTDENSVIVKGLTSFKTDE
jgi:hypothetical protein